VRRPTGWTVSQRARAVAGLTVCTAALVLGTAAPAAAHAVLLGSDPAPQSVLATAPPRVRLQFSEPVETTFGSIRVVDNGGHDITSGPPVRSPNGREIDVKVRPGQGTAYVIWKVVSGDGHAESGTFAFSVGAPSKGPAHAVPAVAGASAAAGWFFAAARFGWFAALFALVGLIVVRRWVWPPAGAGAGGAGGAGAGAGGAGGAGAEARVDRRFGATLKGAWFLSLVSGAAILVGQAAADAGRSLRWSVRPSSVNQVLQTSAGHHWLVAILLAGAAGLPVYALSHRAGRGLGTGAWAAALGALGAEAVVTAQVGHARTLQHGALGVPSLAVHLLAVGVWVGGLGALVVLGSAAWRELDPAPRSAFVGVLVRRFSRVAVAAVAAVVASGLLSAILDLGRPSDLVTLPYGRVLLLKIVLLQVALLLGAHHLWFVPASLGDARSVDGATSSFERSAIAELGVLTLVVAAATGLMVMNPGRSVAQAASGRIVLERTGSPYTVDAAIAPGRPGTDQLVVVFSTRGVAARAVTHPTAALGAVGAPEAPVPLVWVSDGRFIGTVELPRAGRYRLDASPAEGAAPATFTFTIPEASGAVLAQP